MANLSDNSSDLWMLNKERWINDIGVVIYLAAMMLFGTVGNAFVFYIYYCKLDNTASNLFVAALSCCDLFGCLVGVPLDIIVILHPYTFYNDFGCRCIRFLVMVDAVISATLVFAISVDRFKKIAMPLQGQITRSQVGQICVVIAIASTAFSLPSFYVYATQEVTTHRLNLTGMECTLSSKVIGRIAYIIFVIVISATVSVALCTIYCLVGIKLCRHKRDRVLFITALSKTISATDLCTVIDSYDYIQEQRRLDKIKKTSADVESFEMRPRLLSISSGEKMQASFINMTRTTFIMFLVSFFWMVSFIPHHVAIVSLAMKPNLKNTLGHAGHAILGIGLRSFYFNNAANPWIYGIFNYRFRQEVCSLLRKAACR